MKFKNKIEQAIDSLVEIIASEKPSYYDIGHGQYPTTIWCMHKGKLLTQKGVDLAHEEEWPDIVNDCTYAGRFDPKKKEVPFFTKKGKFIIGIIIVGSALYYIWKKHKASKEQPTQPQAQPQPEAQPTETEKVAAVQSRVSSENGVEGVDL